MVEERGRAGLGGRGVLITVVWVRVRSFFTATYCLQMLLEGAARAAPDSPPLLPS